MNRPSDLDPNAVRRQFSRRAGRLVRADFLLREVERRMLERLEVVRLAPAFVLDVGSGLGQGAVRLKQRYPAAHVLGLDVAEALVRTARRTHGPPARAGLSGRLLRWFGGAPASAPTPDFAVADAARLPLRVSSVDLLWSNLAWHWFADPVAVIDEWHRVIRPNGLLMFSAFGVDTLRELRGLGARLPVFPDMHDIGDALAHAGFAEPVMDAERLTVTWEDASTLLAEVSSLGGDPSRLRRSGLAGRGRRLAWIDAIESLRGADGRLSLTFELVFGHAWVPERKRRADGLATVRFAPGVVPRKRSGPEAEG
jgi:malonyl-CoA O-methyltransferase